MNSKDIKFDFDDIVIEPAILSDIESRTEIRLDKTNLPLFVAPMDTVVDKDNLKQFLDLGYNVAFPRNEEINPGDEDSVFISVGLSEAETMLTTGNFPKKLLIDVANGHMKRLYNIAKSIKSKYPDVILMVGNIANPLTYKEYAEIGVDYIRAGIGGGCFTPDSLIITDNGLKRIKDINIGDKVLTHNNIYKEVLHKFEYDKDENLLKVNNIKCTKNHEFYVINRSDKELINIDNIKEYAFWIEAIKLDKSKHLLVKY